MNQELFQLACRKVAAGEGGGTGVGTLSEKTLHAVLKQYIDPHPDNHEVKIGPYVADIVGENGIVEIQTGNFQQLRKKLAVFLEVAAVTVVYPIPREKHLCWVDPDTGELSPRRKSPKRGNPYYALYELCKIKELLLHPNLRLQILLLDMEEYRSLNGWSRDRKRGSTRYERIPTALVEEIAINCPGDYALLVPEELPETFTSKEYQKAAGLSLSSAQRAVNLLSYVGALERTGKAGRLYTYTRRDNKTAE